MSDHKDMTHRHLKHKLQSLSRRLDELEEATNKLQKSEDELLDLQDKIIQAEGSNSSLLDDVEGLRKRLLKIQGKDEEVRKAEDLCRTVREKLEEEESLTKELKAEIERLQRRMAELEKLEEAFAKSKSDCSQLCLSLNEEKNLTKKLSSELETLKIRLKEVESSEMKLDKAEQALVAEFDKIKGFTQAFVAERKKLLEKQKEDEIIILKLREKLDQQKNRLGLTTDGGHADYLRSRIEDELSTTGLFTTKLGGCRKSLDYIKLSEGNCSVVGKAENEKKSSLEVSQEEDNKVKELTQEVERLKSRLKHLEIVEEDLKNSEFKNGELNEKFQFEQNRVHQLNEQLEQLKAQVYEKSGKGGNMINNVERSKPCPGSPTKVLENGKAGSEEVMSRGGFRQEKPKFRSAAATPEPGSPSRKNRELSPQHRRDAKLRTRELNHLDEGSPRSLRRPLSPAHKIRRIPKTQAAVIPSDNGLRDSPRVVEERTRGSPYGSTATASSEAKKVSVLSRYPPAANDQKPVKTSYKQIDGEIKKGKEKFANLCAGSDSESNNSDVVPETCHPNNTAALERDAAVAFDQESVDQVQESMSLTLGSAKTNGSYTAYRSHITQLLPNDQGSEGHSSASETESTCSRPSESETIPDISTNFSNRSAVSKYSRYPHVHDSHSDGSSSRSSFDEELQTRSQCVEGMHQGSLQSPPVLEIQRVCSPREALRSKAVIKPAITEIDRKEIMISESLSTNGKPKISTKPIVMSTTSKMTSSITIYPNDPGSSRTSSRSSSVSSEAMPVRERHTSTSNILIGSSLDHHGSISIPYEISIPKSEITMRPCQDLECGTFNHGETSSKSKLPRTTRMEPSPGSRCSHRSSLSDTLSGDINDSESGFESSSSTTTVTSWRSQRHNHHGQEDGMPDMKNVTVRSTWRNRGAGSGNEISKRGVLDGGSEDEAEAPTTWRAYRATTFDGEETLNSGAGSGGMAQKSTKPSPAEMYMRRINTVTTNTKETEEATVRRGRSSQSPVMEVGGVGRTIPHAPVTSQSWNRSYPHQTPTTDSLEPGPNPSRSPASWRRALPGTDSQQSGTSHDRLTKTAGATSRGGAEAWSSRWQGSGTRAESRIGAGSRQWSHRQPEHH